MMKRRHYFIAFIVDILSYLVLTVCFSNFLLLITAGILSLFNITLVEGDWFLVVYDMLEIVVYIGFIYFYFIYVPFHNKQGTLGDTLVNFRLKRENNEEVTQGFLIKRLGLSFILNILLLSSFIYTLFNKKGKKTLHDKIMKSEYEYVKVIKKDKKKKA